MMMCGWCEEGVRRVCCLIVVSVSYTIGYSLGVSELEMMKLGGWSDTKTMHKIYTHIAEADLLKSKNKIANFFGGEIVEKASGD